MNVDKPYGVTSHDVVARVRRASGMQKMGHAGTLDPLATGVLILCVGGATRLSEYVMHERKRYLARVRFGIVTETYDAEGEIVRVRDASRVTREDVEGALGQFRGEIEQFPPMYSAIKQGGRKLYDLARAGETVEREARKVRIEAITVSDPIMPDNAHLSDPIIAQNAPKSAIVPELFATSDRNKANRQPTAETPEFILDVTCSAGTYIRSLAYDLGEVLGVGAYLAGLRRIQSGRFALENATPLDTLLNALPDHLVSAASALQDYPTLRLGADAEQEIQHGRSIPARADTPEGTVAMAYRDERLVAVLKAESGRLKPQKVFV